MKKQFFIALLLSFSSLFLWAERIDVVTARKIAENVAVCNSGGLRASGNLSLIYAAVPGQERNSLRSNKSVDGIVDYFVFNVGVNNGFVIVSGDDRAYPVLGYSDEGNFDPDNLPDNLRGMLVYYQNQIGWAERKSLEATSDVQTEWGRIQAGGLRSTGKEVLIESALWDQNNPYNRQTPIMENGEHAPTGCTATAWAIVMRHNKYPNIAQNGVTSYFGNSVVYESYNWDKMRMSYKQGAFTEEEADAVSALMWNIGANIEMEYTAGSSAADCSVAAKAARNVFRYSPACRNLRKNDYRWREWKSMLRKELDEGRLVVYSGSSSIGGGHTFVCDGYREEGEAFHINWGWNGGMNGYYLLTALGNDETYSNGMGMTIGIRPPQDGDVKTYELKYDNLQSPSSLSVGTDFDVKLTVYFAGDDDFSIPISMAIIHADGTIGNKITEVRKEKLKIGWYSALDLFICKLTSPLAKGEKILPVYSEDGENWKIMTRSLDAPLYISMDGVVDAEPEPDDSGDHGVNPLNISLLNSFSDDCYFGVSTPYEVQKSYSIVNAAEDVVIRYIFKDYSDWEEDLSLSYKKEENIVIPVPVGEDGSFEVAVTKSDLQLMPYHDDYFEVFSTKFGIFEYDIQIYYASDSERLNLLFEQTGNVLAFVKSISTSITPDLIKGAPGQAIPFTVKISDDVDSELVNKEYMTFDFGIQYYADDGVKLFYVDGVEEKEIDLSNRVGNKYFYSKRDFHVGSVTAGKEYKFKIKCVTKPSLTPPGGQVPYIAVSPSAVNGKHFVHPDGDRVELSITEQLETSNAVIGEDFSLWAVDGKLYIRTSTPGVARILTFSGQFYRTIAFSGGEFVTELPSGVYVVQVGTRVYKICI